LNDLPVSKLLKHGSIVGCFEPGENVFQKVHVLV
jgi:hypothetical protein